MSDPSAFESGKDKLGEKVPDIAEVKSGDVLRVAHPFVVLDPLSSKSAIMLNPEDRVVVSGVSPDNAIVFIQTDHAPGSRCKLYAEDLVHCRTA